jgi:hypothetical protein
MMETNSWVLGRNFKRLVKKIHGSNVSRYVKVFFYVFLGSWNVTATSRGQHQEQGPHHRIGIQIIH